MAGRMWALAEFRFDEGIEAAQVLVFDGVGESRLMARDDAIALARARGASLVAWWPFAAGDVPSCIVAKVSVPLRWEEVPDDDVPVPADERLWFEAACGGRDFIVGNGHTFPGRLAAWCPHDRVGYSVSLAEMGVMPMETRYFVAGFLAGNEPEHPADEQGDSDEADIRAWQSALRRFRRTGSWFGRWGTCEECGCVLLPDSAASRCARHIDERDWGWQAIVAPWHLDERMSSFPVPAGSYGLVSDPVADRSGLDRVVGLCEETARLVAQATRPLVLSGDCVVALGVTAGLQRRHEDLAVVWLDAHGDFNTPATTITGYLGGMPLAMLTGRGRELIGDRLGVRPVPDDRVVLVDGRDLDPAESEALAASGVRHVPAVSAAIAEALGPLRDVPVYLHVDLDIVDSAELAGLRVPAGSGPNLALIRECLAGIAATATVVGACLACTWLPDHVGGESAREAVSEMASALGASLTWTPTDA
ncbi:MAG TPA: arginase family protein [Streptosporangiaceae bacterium]|nr:arginase family protein [Streptosporangiaceae bacterium]